jgi:inosine/xanthosine triphosphatase
MSQIVVIASRNPVKIEAVRQAFEACFPARNFRFEGVQVPSGVSDQPMTDEETRRGARQRAESARAEMPQADFWVGLEGGLETDGQDLRAFAWMVVASANNRGEARTACFPLPPQVAALVREGRELGEADDIVFGQTNSKQQGGAVGLLTQGRISRTTYYREALILALIPFLQTELY